MTDKATELLAEILGDLTCALNAYPLPNIYEEYEASKYGEVKTWEGILIDDLKRIKQYLDSIGYNENDPQRDAEKYAPHQCDVPNPRE